MENVVESFSYWTLFFTAALVINISPGPDLLYILLKNFYQLNHKNFLDYLFLIF